MYSHEFLGHGFFMPGMFLWVIFFAVIIWAVITLTNKKQPPTHDEDDALKIARRRFAKGEITEEEFDKIKEKLS